MIVQVSVVLRRTVVGSGDWCFDNLSGSHHQSQVKSSPLDSDDDFRSDCRNVSHHYWQQSFSGLHSPRWWNYTINFHCLHLHLSMHGKNLFLCSVNCSYQIKFKSVLYTIELQVWYSWNLFSFCPDFLFSFSLFFSWWSSSAEGWLHQIYYYLQKYGKSFEDKLQNVFLSSFWRKVL